MPNGYRSRPARSTPPGATEFSSPSPPRLPTQKTAHNRPAAQQVICHFIADVPAVGLPPTLSGNICIECERLLLVAADLQTSLEFVETLTVTYPCIEMHTANLSHLGTPVFRIVSCRQNKCCHPSRNHHSHNHVSKNNSAVDNKQQFRFRISKHIVDAHRIIHNEKTMKPKIKTLTPTMPPFLCCHRRQFQSIAIRLLCRQVRIQTSDKIGSR